MRHSHCRLSCRLALHLLRACPPTADSFSDAIFSQSPCPCPCPPFTQEESTVGAMLWMTENPSHCRQNVDGGRDFDKSNVSVECSAAQCRAASLTVSFGALRGFKLIQGSCVAAHKVERMPMTRCQKTLPIISNPTLPSKILDAVSTGDAPRSRVTSLVSILQRRNPAGCETPWDRFRSWACFGLKSVMQV